MRGVRGAGRGAEGGAACRRGCGGGRAGTCESRGRRSARGRPRRARGACGSSAGRSRGHLQSVKESERREEMDRKEEVIAQSRSTRRRCPPGVTVRLTAPSRLPRTPPRRLSRTSSDLSVVASICMTVAGSTCLALVRGGGIVGSVLARYDRRTASAAELGEATAVDEDGTASVDVSESMMPSRRRSPSRSSRMRPPSLESRRRSSTTTSLGRTRWMSSRSVESLLTLVNDAPVEMSR